MVEIIVAIIGGVVAISVARLSQKVGNVHAEVKTNHGMKTHQYIERIDANQAALLELMAEHTAQDERNFSELRREIAKVRGDKAA